MKGRLPKLDFNLNLIFLELKEISDTELEDKAVFLYRQGIFNTESIDLLGKMEPFNKYTKDWEKFFAEQIQKGNI